MIKRGFVFVIFVIVFALLISSVSALSLNLKDSYQLQETGIAKISGDIREPISRSQISFYRGHVLVSSFDYDITKIGTDYYVWFVNPTTSNNYTLEISEISALVNGRVQETTLTKNFSVSGNLTDYYITPGAVISNQDFEIKLVLNEDSSKIINVNFPVNRDILVSPGENTIKFSLDSLDSTKILNINLGKYIVPAYLIKKAGSIVVNGTNETISSMANLTISPKRIERTANSDEKVSYPIEISNIGSNNVSGIEIKYNRKALTLDSDLIEELDANSSFVVNVSALGTKDIEEIITISADNFGFNLPVKISFEKMSGTQNQTNTEDQVLFDCTVELAGKQCTIDQICTGQTEQSQQGSCCLGECISATGSTGSKAWIGWLIAIVVLGVLGYIYYKYKGVKPTTNPIEKQVGEIEKRAIKPEVKDLTKLGKK
jgi:hypothetical protein